MKGVPLGHMGFDSAEQAKAKEREDMDEYEDDEL